VVVGLGDSDLSSPNSDLSLNLLARAWLVSDNDDSLAGLGADLGSLGPNIKSLLSVLSSLDSDPSELEIVSSNLGTPSSDVGFSARTWLVFDDDDLAGLSTSADSASENILLSDELLSPDLNSERISLSFSDSFRKFRVSDPIKSNLISVDFRTTSSNLDVEISSDLESVNNRWFDCVSVSERTSFSFADISVSVGSNNSSASDSVASDSSGSGSVSTASSYSRDFVVSDSSSSGSVSAAGSSARDSHRSGAIHSSDRSRGV
jgi:hypothetical protein